MLPEDTITFITEITGTTTQTIINPPYTVLGIAIEQERLASDTWIMSGSQLIFKNYAQTTPYTEFNYWSATNSLVLIKTGNDKSLVVINYVKRIRSEVKDNNFDNASTTNGQYDGTILTNYFLFLIICGLIFGFILKRFFGKYKNTMQ